MKGAIVVLLLAAHQAAMSNAASDPKLFFKDIKNNLTEIVWAHAVNSAKDLTDNLADNKVMMLEADVKMGKKKTTDTEMIPIMSHNASESDLSLEEFVEKAIANSKKGIKLDFKETTAFEKSEPLLKNLTEAKFPVFLNADILKGPEDAENPTVDKDTFLRIAKQFNSVTVSLGWTTKWNEKATNMSYTDQQVEEMLKKVAEFQLTQPITYAVRAVIAANSHKQMMNLLKDTNNTLTIWTAKDDKVNATELSNLIKHIDVTKVYLDVPDDLKSKMNLNAGASSMTVATMTVLGSLLVSLFLNGMPRRG